MAEFLYATSHLTGNCPSPANALGASDGTWAGPTGTNSDWDSRWAIDNPADPLTDSATQTIRVTARKTNHDRNPSATVELWENGSLVTQLSSVTVTSTAGQTISGTFNTSAVTDPDAVEVRITTAHGGGPPNSRASVQLDGIEWEADTSVSAPSASGGSSVSVTVPTIGAGFKVGAGGAESTVLTPTAGDGAKATAGGSDATTTVTATGGGEIGSEDKSGGSATTVNVTVAGDGHKGALDGSAVSLVTSTTGNGEKGSYGGSDLNVTIDVTGGGQASVAGGGGSSTTVDTITTGDGTKAARGGSTASVLIPLEGAGAKATSGGSDAQELTSTTGGGTSTPIPKRTRLEGSRKSMGTIEASTKSMGTIEGSNVSTGSLEGSKV